MHSHMLGLAVATLSIMRLLRIGPFGHAQRQWQNAMEEGRSSFSTQLPLGQSFDRFDVQNKRAPGTTLSCWSLKVLEPACTVVSELLAALHVPSDHPVSVSQGLYAAGLMPAMAAQRISISKAAVAQNLVNLLREESIQSLRCPTRTDDITWLGHRNCYAQWLSERRRADPQQQVVYPLMDTVWSQHIRSWPLPLRVTLNAHEINAELQQRMWPDNRIKVMGTLICHPKLQRVDTSLLRHVAHTDPHEQGISALAEFLRDEEFESLAGPVLLVDVVEKSKDVSHDEVVHGLRNFIGSLLRIHSGGQNLGCVVWNTLPSPWIYPPSQSELLLEDWQRYEKSVLSTSKVIERITATLRSDHGSGMGSFKLQWDRKQ